MLAIEHRVVGSRTRNALLRHSHRELLAQQTRIPFLWLSAIRVADVDVRCGAEDAQMGALRVHVVVHLATPLWSRLAAALAQLVCADRRRNDRQHSAYELRAGRGITRVKFMYSTAVACEGETNLNWNLLLFYLIKAPQPKVVRLWLCLLYVDALSCLYDCTC